MHRHILLLPIVLALSATSPAAAADPLDIVAGTVQTAGDRLAAHNAHLRHTADASGNISCTQPVAYGVEVAPHSDLVVSETRQTDMAVASVTCVDLRGTSLWVGLEIVVEYCAYRLGLTGCAFFPSDQSSSVAYGHTAATATATLLSVYDDLHPGIGKVRRVYACVRTPESPIDCHAYDYSATYGH